MNLSFASHSKPICTGCGLCCKLFLINLNEKEYRFGNFRTIFEEFGQIEDFSLAADCGANFLAQQVGGNCIYLENGKCSIHDTKPAVCREFFCLGDEKKFAKMRHEIDIARNL